MDTPSQRLGPEHRDHKLLTRIEQALINAAGGWEKFCLDIPQLLRQAIDEVIDSPRSGRFTVDQLEKTEKTYLGTKIEILLRNHLRLKKGSKLDLELDGVPVDVKNTIGNNWTIPLEAHNQVCLLISTDEKRALCSLGLMMVRPEVLNPGVNRDKKSTITAASMQHIHWLLRHTPYPQNFWERIGPSAIQELQAPKTGTKRLVLLFKTYQRIAIPRSTILALAPQKDALKRLRKNGGARDQLFRDGIALLSGDYDERLILRLGLPFCRKGEFISVKPETEEEAGPLREHSKVPR